MSPTPPALRLAAGLALAALLTGCAATTGDAGVRVTPSDSPVPPSGSSPAASAPADLVASADLADCPASDPKAAVLDDGLPDVVLPCLGDGPAVRLAGLRGTPTVVNVWASWCEPCREELTVFADLAGSVGTGVHVLGIDATDDPSSAVSLLTDAGVHYASVRDDSGVTKAPMAWGSGLPVTYLVDADGHVVFTQHGAIASADELNRLVSEHLGVTVPA
jgi:thiol-disulfide isomerase/thioredoxin